jgi:hypothetical protein
MKWGRATGEEVGMFGRIQPVKNGSAVSAVAPSDDGGDDAVVGDVQLRRSCREFLEALRAYEAFNPDALSASEPEPTIDRQGLEEVAYKKMERALQEVRSLKASCSAGFQAKFEVLFALEDWFSEEDFRVVGLALELAGEAYAFFVAGQAGGSKPSPKISSGSSYDGREFRLGFPRLFWFAGEPRSSTPSRARRSQR